MFTTGGSAMDVDVVLARRSCEVSGSPPLTALLAEGTDQSKKLPKSESESPSPSLGGSEHGSEG